MKKILSIFLVFLMLAFNVYAEDDYITRGEFAVELNAVCKFETEAENIFSDLKDKPYKKDILCLNHEKIMNGYENKIRPDDFISREEAAVMLVKALKLETNNFFNVKFEDENSVSGWAVPYMSVLVNKGFLKGSENLLMPKRNITKEETALLIKRCFNINDKPAEKEENNEISEETEEEIFIEEIFCGGAPPEEEEAEEKPTATVSIEAFTVGGGYVLPPVQIEIEEDMNCAYILDEILNSNGFEYMNTGSLDGDFYLSSISGIGNLTPNIPEVLINSLADAGYTLNQQMYTEGELSEFDFTHGSGWMYSVNGEFPSVGFSEYVLNDGDVMRVQFTLAYGADIGGTEAKGFPDMADFYEIVNRDELTKKIAELGIEHFSEYMDLITKPDLTEDELNSILKGAEL